MASRPFIDIPLGQYAPDLGGLPWPESPGYLVDAVNVMLTPNGYRGLPTFTDVTSATTAGTAVYGGFFRYQDASVAVSSFFVASSSGTILESRAEGSDTWQTVTPGGGLGTFVYQATTFFQYNDDVILINAGMSPLKKSLTSSHATAFTALGGSPPQARFGGTVREHVVLSGLPASDYYAVQWSAIGDHEDWPTPGTADARNKQAGTQTLNKEHGRAGPVLGGEKIGIIAQEYALTRMTYVGGSAVYSFDTFHRQSGYGRFRWSPFVSDGERWYWYNDKGFYATDGYAVEKVSEGRLDDSIFNDLVSHADADNILESNSGGFDDRRSLVLFCADPSNGLTKHLCYNTTTKSFSFYSDSTIRAIFQGESLAGEGASGGRFAYGYSSAPKLQKFSGATGTIALQTGYIELDPGYRVQLQGAHILGTGTGSLTLAYKTAASSAACDVLQTGFTSLTAAGLGEKKTGRASAQYIAFRITGTGAESQLIRGIRVYFERAEPAP